MGQPKQQMIVDPLTGTVRAGTLDVDQRPDLAALRAVGRTPTLRRPAADKEEPRVGRDPGFRKRRWLRGLDSNQ